jgi:CBS domain containing-hemolysin-like protein
MPTSLAFLDLLALSMGGSHITDGPMNAGTILGLVLLIILLVLLNAFFVASEFAIVKVRSSQLDAEIETGSKAAKRAKFIVERLDTFLSVNQLGITFTSIALGAVGQPFFHQLLEPLLPFTETVVNAIAAATSFAIASYLHVVLGELVPKSLAIRYSLKVSMLTSGTLLFFYWIFRPAIWLLNGNANFILRHILRIRPLTDKDSAHSGEEIRLIVSASEQQSEVTPTEKDILLNALELNDFTARDIMTPRNVVISLDAKRTFKENMKTAVDSGHTRFPLVEGHLDSTLGFIHIKDLFRKAEEDAASISDLKRPLLAVPESIPVDKLLKFFLEKQAHMALVVDEFGGAVGIVTLDNVLEEIVGEIKDEFDAHTVSPQIEVIGENEFACDGNFGLYELGEHLDVEFEDTDATTVGGYVTELLGTLPQEGDEVTIGPWIACTTKSDGRRVIRVSFSRIEKNGETDGSDDD